MPLDPLYQLDIAEKPLSAPAGGRIRRRSVMDPDPFVEPAGGRLAELHVEARLDERTVPPWAHREQRIADRKAVAIAGDAELAHLADPARDLLAFLTAFVEVVIARAQDDPGALRQQRQILFNNDDLGAEIDIEPTSSASPAKMTTSNVSAAASSQSNCGNE